MNTENKYNSHAPPQLLNEQKRKRSQAPVTTFPTELPTIHIQDARLDFSPKKNQNQDNTRFTPNHQEKLHNHSKTTETNIARAPP